MDPKSWHLVTSVYILKMTLIVCAFEGRLDRKIPGEESSSSEQLPGSLHAQLSLESCGLQLSGELGRWTISTWNPVPGTCHEDQSLSPDRRVGRAHHTPSLPALPRGTGVLYKTWLCVCLHMCVSEKQYTEGVRYTPDCTWVSQKCPLPARADVHLVP